MACSLLRKGLLSESLVSSKYAVDVLLDCFELAVSVRRGGNSFVQQIFFVASRVVFLPSEENTMHVVKEHVPLLGSKSCCNKICYYKNFYTIVINSTHNP